MARKIRLFVRDTPQHVIIRGINNMTVFLDEEDYQTFLAILKVLVEKVEIELHAYILMPTYFQFLATPLHQKALSQFMQSLGRRYVGYFNKKYNRQGTIWDGRYKSSLIEVEEYLFEVMKFIEKKPKDEKIMDTFKAYPYSSIHKNIFFKYDTIVTQHKSYNLTKYLKLLEARRDEDIYSFIASSLEKQNITGSIKFIKNLEKEINSIVLSKKRGRPKKENREKIIQRKKMYNNLVLVDKKEHKNLKVSAIEKFFFADDLKLIPIVSSEFKKISVDYPIVFAEGEELFVGALVALGNKNLALSSEGKWYGSYVPAYVRKYPFALVSSQKNPQNSLVLIDTDSSLVSKDEGEMLFKEDGSQSDFFKKKIELISLYEQDRKRTSEIIKIILSANILENGEITVGQGEEKKVLVAGFKAINKKRYDDLTENQKKGWQEAGVIDFIEEHLKSLSRIDNLFTLANQQQN